MTKLFTRDGAWDGGGYGLAIVVRPPNDADAQTLLRRAWKSEGVKGCFASRKSEPSEQQSVEPTIDTEDLYGVLTVNGVQLPMSSALVRMPDEDWLYLTVPMAAIYDAFNAGVTPPNEPPSWEPSLLPWFLDRARDLAATVQFEVAFLGFFGDNAEDTELDRFESTGSVPAERILGFFVPSDPQRWYPATPSAS